MIWKLSHRVLEQSAIIMGVLNVTPDSFSDGAKYLNPDLAVDHAIQMLSEGADIVDVGGESTRPGADPVSVDEELRRVIPVIERLRLKLPDVLISVDTYKAETARQAIAAGANIVNDITAGQGDSHMLGVLKRSGVGVILMHMQGKPKTMHLAPRYSDVVSEVLQFLQHRRDEFVRSGIEPARIALDPGFGFGKLSQHNLDLLCGLPRFASLNSPIAVGISRKSMLAKLLGHGDLPMADRLWPTVALTSILRYKGAQIFRVHDVKPNALALRVTEAVLSHEQRDL
ncbi:MAG: dihydropteroate synthase [Verrucomicrobia bacterium]|nr:dihydropteroate synthase [Verrucomicrobiota bacterium]MBV9673103.1 dihydropteroate synthase [Verrucomicrobiota bacterium]